jgi:hypothetical protein
MELSRPDRILVGAPREILTFVAGEQNLPFSALRKSAARVRIAMRDGEKPQIVPNRLLTGR